MTTSIEPGSKASLNKAYNPFLQGAVIVVAMIAFLGFGELLSSSAPDGYKQRIPWIIVTAMLLLFAVSNSIFCLVSDKPVYYWGRSVITYILLAAVAIFMASFLSGLPIRKAGSFEWLFFVVSFSYLVFISIVNLIRIIVAFAEKEEWLAPRSRNRDRY